MYNPFLNRTYKYRVNGVAKIGGQLKPFEKVVSVEGHNICQEKIVAEAEQKLGGKVTEVVDIQFLG